MILRIWKSTIRASDLDRYVAYISTAGTTDYDNTEGNCGHQILSRELENGLIEITTLSWWRDLDCIKAFAGEDYEAARYYPSDDAFLVTKEARVQHFQVISGTKI